MVEVRGKVDSDVQAVEATLDEFCRKHPKSQATIYRYNPASIRVRVVSAVFEKMDKADRHDYVWAYVEPLDEEVVEQVSVLLLLTPQEHKSGRSMMNIEFEDPSPSVL